MYTACLRWPAKRKKGENMSERERKEALLRKLNKLEAYHEIQNEMGRLTAAFNFHQREAVAEHFAWEMEDVSVEYADEGRFEGKKAVEAVLDMLLGKPAEPGEMLDMQLTTPMIEVADDLRTAKCVWWCPGAGAWENEEGAHAIWVWGQVAADFIFTKKREWKVWHLHYFRFIKCAYEKGWVEDTSMIHRANTAMHPESLPGTYHNPYSPLSVREGIPAMPLPYQTYRKEDRYWELSRDKR